jgi:hypothetical protein
MVNHMRLVLTFVIAVLVGMAAPAVAQEADRSAERSRDGGLRVCCGATFGYIGGSGTISGEVRGPAGGSSQRAPAPAPAPDPEPNVLMNGEVTPVKVTSAVSEEPLAVESAPASWPRGLLGGIMAAVVLAGIVIGFRRRSATVGEGEQSERPRP